MRGISVDSGSDKTLSNQPSSKKEAKARLEAALRGAFAGPPTPLKDIPKRNGESRAERPQRRRRQRKKRSA